MANKSLVITAYAPPERGTVFRRQVSERVGILLAEVYERVRKSVIWVCKRTKKG